MSANYNSLPNPGNSELDPATAEAVRRAQLVKFAPQGMWEAGHPKSSGEFHVAALCRTPGDTLTFSLTSRDAARAMGTDAGWMDLGAGGAGSVWVVTETGNRYGIGCGHVFNANAKGAFALDPNAAQLQLSVGREATLPGVGTTSAIKSILVADEVKYGDETYSWTGHDASQARLVNEEVDPLFDVRAIGEAVNMGTDPGFAVGVLVHDVSLLRGNASFV